MEMWLRALGYTFPAESEQGDTVLGKQMSFSAIFFSFCALHCGFVLHHDPVCMLACPNQATVMCFSKRNVCQVNFTQLRGHGVHSESSGNVEITEAVFKQRHRLQSPCYGVTVSLKVPQCNSRAAVSRDGDPRRGLVVRALTFE